MEMTESASYSVITNGELLKDFEPAQVIEAFAALFKITPEKAGIFLKDTYVIKEKIDLKSAEQYKSKLENIGLQVMLKENVQSTAAGSSLSLEPTDDEIQAESVAAKSPDTSEPDTITCPKCATELPASAEQCKGCGVYMHKVLDREEAESPQSEQADDGYEESEYSEDEGLSGKSLAAGAAAALAGAVVWSLIASMFGYELGMVAWAIGGAVGFAVASTGSNGLNAGIACGVLALVAILGGKYMMYSDYRDEITDAFAGSMDEMRYIYESEMEAVEAYSEVVDDGTLRQFMVENGYSDYADADSIPDEEIEYFQEYDAPRLGSYSYTTPTFEDWYQSTFIDSLNDVSTTELIKENFAWIDFVFLLLGVATAFRLGRGCEN